MRQDTPQARLLQEAVSLFERGRLAEADSRLDRLLRLHGRQYSALLLLGIIHARLGRLDSAVALLTEAARANPRAPEARNNLGMALHAAGRFEEAAESYEAAITLNPRYAVALNNLGNTLSSLTRPEEAIARYRAALTIEPGYAEARNNLGVALLDRRRPEEAVAEFRRALAGRPGFAEARANLATALGVLERHPEAIALRREALLAGPEDPGPRYGLGRALHAADRHEEAIAAYRETLQASPAMADAHASLGTALQQIGRSEAAAREFEAALRLEPKRATHYLSLVGTRTMTPGDPHLAAMLALSDGIAALPEDEQAMLHFALGKALADVGEHARAFAHLLDGNRLHRRHIAYDEARFAGRLHRTRAVVTADVVTARKEVGDPSELPVFILGMPRSGSTLVEQILAAHPRVFAAGELAAFRDATRAVAIDGGPMRFPDDVPRLTDADLRDVAADYLARISALPGAAGPAARITDKMPANARYAGLIHMALPNARIIHTMRDPIDTCLSCFALKFDRQPFTFDLGELGRYYRAHDRLMAHWRAVLPPGVMLEVKYETLVGDFEAEARRIVAYCGLPWDDACLRFHEADRPVRTASMTQVRQPLYRTSVSRWHPDLEILRPLLDGLGPELARPGGS